MKVKNILVNVMLIGSLGACAVTQPPLYGNYENIDNKSLCLGIMAFGADYPSVVWPNQSKSFYETKKEELGIRSTALYKILVENYGKENAAERGATGYSSAKSLVYVLGPKALQNALSRCEPVAEEAIAANSDYQKFLNHLDSTKPTNPINPDVVESKTKIATPLTNAQPTNAQPTNAQPTKNTTKEEIIID